MSKPTNKSRSPESASDELIEQSKAVANDAVLLRELVESSDSNTVTAAFAMLHTDDSGYSAPNQPKKTTNRPCPRTPNETVVDILLFMDRDALDAMQLACRFLLEFIRNREVKKLPLRSILRVELVEFYSSCRSPFQVVRDSHTSFYPPVSELVTYLRLAYCMRVDLDIGCTDFKRSTSWSPTSVRPWSSSSSPPCAGQRDASRSEIFGLIVLPNTFVHVLMVRMYDACAFHTQRCVEAFNRVSGMIVTVEGYEYWPCFNEAFFLTAAERGVRSLKFNRMAPNNQVAWTSTSSRRCFDGIDVLGALSFGLTEPTSGGDRCVRKVLVSDMFQRNLRDNNGNVNFLAPLVKKASELDGRQYVDFKFTIDKLRKPIDPAGFEKYQKDERSWLVNDLENGIMLEVVEANRVVEIRVFSLF